MSLPGGTTTLRSKRFPLLGLLRIQLTLTAIADSFSGYCIAVAATNRTPSAWVALALAATSIFIYWAGMVSNDLFDMEKDGVLHPRRPLPVKEVTPLAAFALTVSLAMAALLVSVLVSPSVVLATLALLTLVLLYNSGGKRIPLLGNLLMGSCRGGNFLLGALACFTLNELFQPIPSLQDASGEILLDAGILGIYIAGVTSVSLLEDHPHRRRIFLASTIPLLCIPVLQAAAAGWSAWALGNALALVAVLSRPIVRGGLALPASPGSGADDTPPPGETGNLAGAYIPHPAETFVRAGLSGIFLVDAGLLYAIGLTGPAMMLYGLMILTWLWRHHWLQSSP